MFSTIRHTLRQRHRPSAGHAKGRSGRADSTSGQRPLVEALDPRVLMSVTHGVDDFGGHAQVVPQASHLTLGGQTSTRHHHGIFKERAAPSAPAVSFLGTWHDTWTGTGYYDSPQDANYTMPISGSVTVVISSIDPGGAHFSGTLIWQGKDAVFNPDPNDPLGNAVSANPLPVMKTEALDASNTHSQFVTLPGGRQGFWVGIGPQTLDGQQGDLTADQFYGPFLSLTLVSHGGVLSAAQSDFSPDPAWPPLSFTTHPIWPDGHTGLSIGKLPAGVEKLAWGKSVTPEFKMTVVQIASDLGTDPNYLMAAMAFESGRTFSPKARNKASGAVGLIQFTSAGIEGPPNLHTTLAALAKMTAVQQLQYVEAYLSPYAGRLNSLSDLYMTILWPIAVGQSDSYVLFSKGSKAYAQNKGLDTNHDGHVTKAEAANRVQATLRLGETPAHYG